MANEMQKVLQNKISRMIGHQVALKTILILSLLIQVIPLTAQILAYQFYDQTGLTEQNWAYYSFIIAGSAISCGLYLVLIPMTFCKIDVNRPVFRLLLFLAMVLQFAVATILTVYIKNNYQSYQDVLQAIDNFEALGYTCDDIAKLTADLCKMRTSAQMTIAGSVVCYAIGFLLTKIVEVWSIRALRNRENPSLKLPLNE